MESREKSRLAAKFAKGKKAEGIVILDMRKIANFCEYFVICSGSSDRQVVSIADAIEEGFIKQKVKASNSNGAKNGAWMLLDYGDVIIHIFNKEIREYYNLERLWIDAKRVRIPKD
ncbi:MAG: ribosome silencing factor [Candidatus Omnitrophica bacterium]|nr:ribosome silencing factor [Candidatus Omnitrophota bacterium]MDD5351992.1 ribosome silencing factor [Candidatus Omnitrophota bacterium]MDD5551046.1 ribosome silencing factor [Candidatus Omnitrophota bacterium]